jgi:hypothetical protein
MNKRDDIERLSNLAARVCKVEDQNARLQGVLSAVEWVDSSSHGRFCPCCGAYKMDGHESGCFLAAALRMDFSEIAETETEERLPLMCSYCSFELQPPQPVELLQRHVERECEYHPIRKWRGLVHDLVTAYDNPDRLLDIDYEVRLFKTFQKARAELTNG